MLSIYAKEQPAFFQAAMESVQKQSWPPDQIVLVCDGPLTPELENVINEIARDTGDRLHIIRRPRNEGLGPALNAGLSECRHDFVARMDTDDIACPQRCEKQLAFMRKNELDLCSGTVWEFTDSITHLEGCRQLPQEHAELLRYAKRRNPMNHPCVMFRKQAVEKAGGYRHMPFFEDYDVWVRMIQTGAKLGNSPEIFGYMRAGGDMYRRRGGVAYCRSINRFFKELKDSGFISYRQYMENLALRYAVSLLPNRLREIFYKRTLRGCAKGRRNDG